jgi:hypothetical protein
MNEFFRNLDFINSTYIKMQGIDEPKFYQYIFIYLKKKILNQERHTSIIFLNTNML